MRRIGFLLLLAMAVLIPLPAGAGEAAAGTAPATVAIEDEALELAWLGLGDVISTSELCYSCKVQEDECADPSTEGSPCSLPVWNCSCSWCAGEIGCHRN